MGMRVKQSRASKPKFIETSDTNEGVDRIRRVKCDEGKPECNRCKSTGRKCDGYALPQSPSAISKQITAVSTATAPGEDRALEFFFHKAAPRLAGFFEGSFWKGSVLQLSLSEPAIRQAIASIGSLYEQEASFHLSPSSDGDNMRSALAVQLYNRAIRSVIEKTAADRSAIPVIVMASILFACFEFLRRNGAAAETHIASGINLLRTWRERTGSVPSGPWGQKYASFESHFIETELAPILSLFNLNTAEFGPCSRSRVLLNGVDDNGLLVLAETFESIREARIALVDMITAALALFERVEAGLSRGRLPEPEMLSAFDSIRGRLDRWKANFEDLTRRRQSTWDKGQQRAADAVRIMWHSADIGIIAHNVTCESDWDRYRPDYEAILQVADSLISDPGDNPDELPKPLSLDLGLIFPLHAVAWKCRWPSLRRKGLDLLLRIPRQEWLLDAQCYHTIFSRIMEVEEAHLNMPSDAIPGDNNLPPEHARVHDFYCTRRLQTNGEDAVCAITFLTKPDGLDKDWHYRTEYLRLGSSQMDAPANLISCKKWARPELTNPATASLLKAAVFGTVKYSASDIS
ncbi:predicted protein [Paecilomyces variotii No. 5]|uniref:Zn(2)-C6 fungal-type domain-containing protein n=1 Tax=Byssochlamys spectabilis (strain No. 5 / NBRC 109023) TaxID=1356009 RepID=V5HWW9_BYSSN|nr:predicted protein [Paecilomyces variotii No. 5]